MVWFCKIVNSIWVMSIKFNSSLNKKEYSFVIIYGLNNKYFSVKHQL